MTGITFDVDAAVFERWPTYIVGCVFARGIRPDDVDDRIGRELADAEAMVRELLGGRDPKDEPRIAVWRQAFGASGWTPSKYLSSVEALARRVARGGQLPRINPIVDLANAAALRHLVPIGAHDPAQFPETPLSVRLASGEDRFTPMGDETDEVPDEGEIVYVAGNTVRTRRWVWRQARTALVTVNTRDIFFPVDGFSDATGTDVAAAVAYIAHQAQHALGAAVLTGLVEADHPRFAVPW